MPGLADFFSSPLNIMFIVIAVIAYFLIASRRKSK